MIIQVGSIRLRVEIHGEKHPQPEMEAWSASSGYTLHSASPDTSLKIFILPEMHLEHILLDEEAAALRRMLEDIEKRFPYAKFPYEWVTGAHAGGSPIAPRPQALPMPFISRSIMDRFSLVPLRHSLLALNHDDRRGIALVRGKGPCSLNSALNQVIQAAVCMLAPEKEAVVLHACSAVLEGNGYLFLGVSGSGKSTIASALPMEHVLSDESTLCFKAHGIPLLGPTPFTQDENLRMRSQPAPLRRVLFLKKDKENFLEDVSPGAAVVRILHNHIHFFSLFRRQEALRAFRAVEGMARSAPASILHFTQRFDPLHFFRETVYEEKKALRTANDH